MSEYVDHHVHDVYVIKDHDTDGSKYIPAMHDPSPATDVALLKETTPCKYSTYTTLYTQSLLNNSFKL